MRRRIRDPHLIMKMTEIGESSRTDVAICYMDDRVDQELLKNLNSRLAKNSCRCSADDAADACGRTV